MSKKDVFSSSLAKVESLIVSVRGVKVIFDSDLAAIYGVSTARLNQQVRRNSGRFPVDFVFQLTREELQNLMLQIATSNVLKSRRAIQMSVFVVRAFVRLREFAATHRELTEKLKEIEHRLAEHDASIGAIIKALRELMSPPKEKTKEIGFKVKEPKIRYGTNR